MQSIRLLAVATGALMLGTACGDGGGVGPNQPPVANFTAPTCSVNVACSFTSTSTDDNGISTYSWDFKDGTPVSTVQNPSHTFATTGTFDVSLTVTDAAGESNTKTNPVIVSAVNVPPPAGFTYRCSAGNCTFTNTSTDDDGTIASYAWDFGEPTSGANNTSALANPTHNYTVTAVTDFIVTLTATDNNGATNVSTQTVRVSQDLVCTGGDCTIVLTSKSTVTITVTAADCEFIGNSFAITQPIQQTVFADGCTLADNTVFTINGGAAFAAGTNLQAQFTQGTKPRPADPDPGPASTRVSGAFPDWTIEFDDGGNTGAPGEPDFNDIVLAVHATVVP